MKIVLVTVGSHGDVQPMLALCLALRDAGHNAVLAGPPERAPWADSLSCPYLPLGIDVTAFIDSLQGIYTYKTALVSARYVRNAVNDQFAALPGIVQGADLVVGASLCFALASIAEAMGIPYRYIAFTPQILPSGAHPFPAFKHQRLPAWCNRLGWQLAQIADRFNMNRLLNRHRKNLGLEHIKDSWPHILAQKPIVASDRALAPLPADIDRQAVQTGYMHMDQPKPPNLALERFLAAGPPPIYAGFGSMPKKDQSRMIPLLKKAAHQAGQRLVIARFWQDSAPQDDSDELLYISRYPHQHLFPGMSAIIHHGGSGTTATSALCGKPQIIVPHILDQFYWGEKVFRSGLGPRPIWRAKITASKLASAIAKTVASPQMAHKARAVSATIRINEGVQGTIKELLSWNWFENLNQF